MKMKGRPSARKKLTKKDLGVVDYPEIQLVDRDNTRDWFATVSRHKPPIGYQFTIGRGFPVVRPIIEETHFILRRNGDRAILFGRAYGDTLVIDETSAGIARAIGGLMEILIAHHAAAKGAKL